jgi:SAM-dependent methyltransferase
MSCILMNNVFEHLHDPVQVLRTCHTALEADGVLVLILPNHAGWSARVFGAAWPGYDAPRHLWGFAPRSLTALLERHGFRVEQIYHQAPGRWAWESALDGRHSVAPAPAWRARAARMLALAMLPFGVLGAIWRHGDFVKVVARRLPA